MIGSLGSGSAMRAGWRLIRQPALGPMHLAFNLRRWPGSNLGFRKAIAEVIDRDELVRADSRVWRGPPYILFPSIQRFR